MIIRIIIDVLMIVIAFCWGCKVGMEHTEKTHDDEERGDGR